MSSKYLSLTHAGFCVLLAACGSPATQGETGGVSESSSTGDTSTMSTTAPTTGPTSGISATGTSDSEGSDSNSETDATSTTSEPLTGTSDFTTTSPGTTTLETTSTTDTSTTTDSTSSTTGDTSSTTTDDTSSSTSDSTTGEPVGCGDKLVAVIRDFKVSHPDMEDYCCGQVDGLVQSTLGPDKKPVFQAAGNPKMLTDAPTFAQWYTDVADVNQKMQIVLDLTEIQPGLYSYASNSFFPADNMLWGNEGNNHNFHFTTVLDTS